MPGLLAALTTLGYACGPEKREEIVMGWQPTSLPLDLARRNNWRVLTSDSVLIPSAAPIVFARE